MAAIAAGTYPAARNLVRVVETKSTDGQSVVKRTVEPLPYVVYGQKRRSPVESPAVVKGNQTGRPMTPLEAYFPGNSTCSSQQDSTSCGASSSSQAAGNNGASNSGTRQKQFVHYGAGFASASQPNRCHFIVHPDWVSERRRCGPVGLKGAAGSQKVSVSGLKYGSG